MQLQFIPASATDRAAVAAILQSPDFRAALAGGPSVADLRAGAAAATANAAVRQAPPDVAITELPLGGVACESMEAPGADRSRVLLYLHGGAFTRGSLALGRANAATLAQASGLRVLAVGYRQAPEHPYPAAPDDVRHAYDALRASGVPARAIAVVGESSGGCLALGLAAHLDGQPGAMPAAIAALSPLTDLELRGASWLCNAATDVADRAMGERMIALYADARQRQDPLASPVRHHFRGCCPLLIAIGSHETMLSDAEYTARRADEAGTPVTLRLYEGMPHGFTRMKLAIANQALAETAAWCRMQLDQAD